LLSHLHHPHPHIKPRLEIRVEIHLHLHGEVPISIPTTIIRSLRHSQLISRRFGWESSFEMSGGERMARGFWVAISLTRTHAVDARIEVRHERADGREWLLLLLLLLLLLTGRRLRSRVELTVSSTSRESTRSTTPRHESTILRSSSRWKGIVRLLLML
jgi:hypothetical protein